MRTFFLDPNVVIENFAGANSALAGGLPDSLTERHPCRQLRTEELAGCMLQSGEGCGGAGREGATSLGRVGWLGYHVG